MKIIAAVLSIVVIGINMFFVVTYISELPSHWAIYLTMAILVLFYLAFVLYLVRFCDLGHIT
jgi:hypothetical protein